MQWLPAAAFYFLAFPPCPPSQCLTQFPSHSILVTPLYCCSDTREHFQAAGERYILVYILYRYLYILYLYTDKYVHNIFLLPVHDNSQAKDQPDKQNFGCFVYSSTSIIVTTCFHIYHSHRSYSELPSCNPLQHWPLTQNSSELSFPNCVHAGDAVTRSLTEA